MVWRSMPLAIPLACGALVALSAAAQARPVTYPGGNMAMVEVEEDGAMVEVVHTLTPQYGVGVRSSWNDAQDWQMQALVGTALLARDNQPQSQANVFASAGLGVASSDVAAFSDDAKPAAFAMLEADWETRRLYVQGRAYARWLEDIDSTMEWRARAGFAPYLAPAGTLQTWLIAQVDHVPEAKDSIEGRAVVRLFSGPVLFEAGLSESGAANAVLWFYF